MNATPHQLVLFLMDEFCLPSAGGTILNNAFPYKFNLEKYSFYLKLSMCGFDAGVNVTYNQS